MDLAFITKKAKSKAEVQIKLYHFRKLHDGMSSH